MSSFSLPCAVGAPDLGGNSPGSAYVFTYTGAPGTGTWSNGDHLAPSTTNGDAVGYSVAITATSTTETAVVSSQLINSGDGAVWVYTRAPGGTSWTGPINITPSSVVGQGENFGELQKQNMRACIRLSPCYASHLKVKASMSLQVLLWALTCLARELLWEPPVLIQWREQLTCWTRSVALGAPPPP